MIAATAPIAELAHVSAALGSDPLLIQGAGGNSSIKQGDTLWVKASGTWMRDAVARGIFVPVSLGQAREAAASGDERRLATISPMGEAAGESLRPSIETALHALMPHAVVIHAHAIESTTTSILAEGAARFSDAMNSAKIAGAFLTYVKPGAPLAAAVASVFATGSRPDVLLLQNHGVVVGAETPSAAAALLRRVEAALALPARDLPEADLESVRDLETEEFALCAAHCGAACDAHLFAVMTDRALMPDQVVFLGGAAAPVQADPRVDQALRRMHERAGVEPSLVYVKGVGALARRSLTEGALAMAQALAEIGRRIPERAAVTGLSIEQAWELADWDAEKFRQRLEAQRAKSD
mgnify:CR=1 FL=1